MANPLFQQLNRGNSRADMAGQFRAFMNQHRGQDPNALIQRAIQERGITQEQLDIIQQRAGQIASQFDGIKHMFGF